MFLCLASMSIYKVRQLKVSQDEGSGLFAVATMHATTILVNFGHDHCYSLGQGISLSDDYVDFGPIGAIGITY